MNANTRYDFVEHIFPVWKPLQLTYCWDSGVPKEWGAQVNERMLGVSRCCSRRRMCASFEHAALVKFSTFLLKEVIKYEFQYYHIINYLSAFLLLLFLLVVMFFRVAVFAVSLLRRHFLRSWLVGKTNDLLVFFLSLFVVLSCSVHFVPSLVLVHFIHFYFSIFEVCTTINYILRITNGVPNEKCPLWWYSSAFAVGPNFLTINYKLLKLPSSSSPSSLSSSPPEHWINGLRLLSHFDFDVRDFEYIFPLNRTYICLYVKIFAPKFQLFKCQWANLQKASERERENERE